MDDFIVEHGIHLFFFWTLLELNTFQGRLHIQSIYISFPTGFSVFLSLSLESQVQCHVKEQGKQGQGVGKVRDGLENTVFHGKWRVKGDFRWTQWGPSHGGLDAGEFGGKGPMAVFEQVCDRAKLYLRRTPWQSVRGELKEDSKPGESRRHIHFSLSATK